MKIMTFNTQHCLDYRTRKIDFNTMAQAIKECGADIVGLQEMRGEGTDSEYTNQVEKLSRLTGMEHYYFAKAIDVGGSNPYGNGLLSKLPILSAETILIPDPKDKKEGVYYETRCILKAKFECGLCVLVTHFGLTCEEQENAVKCVLEHLENERCILMGDFNMSPDNELLLPLRERMRDAADMFSGLRLSFPSDVPKVKIDYVFASCDMEIAGADIPEIIASDHRPHTAEIVFRNRGSFSD